MSQLTIVTTPQNSGQGTPLATAFNYTNSNFSELYARYQTAVPATLVGKAGDVPGMYATDSTFFYYCFAPYNDTDTIWAQLTQVGNIALTQIQNGNSNVLVNGTNSNVTVSINNTSNVAVFATTGVYAKGVVSATGNVRGSYILGNGSQLTGLPATYTDTNVAIFMGAFGSNNISSTGNVTTGNVLAGNLLTTGAVSATGNVTGNYILGNAALMTGLPVLYNNTNVAAFLSAFGSNTISSTGTITTTANISGGNVLTGGRVSATGNVIGGNISTVGNVVSQGIVSATGNIVTSGYFVGTFVGNVTGNFVVPGANTQVLYNTNGNADATAGFTYNSGSNTLTVLGIVSSQGNVIGGNLTTAGSVSATGNAVVGNITTAGSVSATGDITGGNITTGGAMSATGTITGGNITTSGYISTTGSVAAQNYFATGNLIANGLVQGGNVSAAGNVTGGNINLTGRVSSTGNVIAGNITTVGILTATGNVVGGNITTAGLISATGNITSAANVVGGNITTVGIVSSTGNAIHGNILSSGIVSATGNITGNNFTGTSFAASGNISANSHTGTSASVTGNVNGGNILTAGYVSATGNVSGNYVFGNGAFLTGVTAYTNANVAAFLAAFGSNSISTTGTVTASSTVGGVITGANVSVAGNITGGNVNTGGNVTGNWLLPTTGVSTGGNILVGGYVSVTGNLYVANIVSQGNLTTTDPLVYFTSTAPYPYNYDIGFYSNFVGNPGNTYQHSGLVRDYTDNTWKLFSNVPEPSGSSMDLTNAIYDPLLIGALTATTISASGNITTAGILTVNSGGADTAIVNGAGNTVGNIGSSSKYFNTVFAQSTSALYADLAENYQADADYKPGTVVVFGGHKEITTTAEFADVSVAGAISTNPAYLMNTSMEGLPVALRGRVPVQVIGPVHKGDLLVTAGDNPGYAVSVGKSKEYPLAVFAKAIETNTDEGVKVITAVIL